MKYWLFNLIYLTAYTFMLPRILWRRRASGRSLGNPAQRLFGRVPRMPDHAAVVWFHAVSVGEVNQLQTLLEQLRSEHPDWQIVVSTTTATGQQLARRLFPDLTTFYFPIDFSWAVRTAFRRIRPALLVLTELEMWPNLIGMAAARNIPLAVINGRLGASSFRGYRRFSWLTRPMFSRLNLVVTQDQHNAERFVALGAPATHVHVVGSLKYDNAARQAVQWRESPRLKTIRQQYALDENGWMLMAGSTQDPEERLIALAYRTLVPRYPELRLVIAPRHPHRADDVAGQLKQLDLNVVRRSRDQAIGKQDRSSGPAPVVLVDTIGELGLWWSLARLAFVGGSFGNRGGQNMLEPAAAGCATCFGPNTWNFSEIVAGMTTAGAGVQINEPDGLTQFLEKCLADPGFSHQLGHRGMAFVDSHQGATRRTVTLLTQAAKPPGQNPGLLPRAA